MEEEIVFIAAGVLLVMCSGLGLLALYWFRPLPDVQGRAEHEWKKTEDNFR
jgi:hypothetical protein